MDYKTYFKTPGGAGGGEVVTVRINIPNFSDVVLLYH